MVTQHIANEEDFDKKLTETMERFMGSLSEDFKEHVKGLADGIIGVQQTLDIHTRILEDHTQMIGNLMIDMSEVKSDIAELKVDMVEVKSDVREMKTDIVEVKDDLKCIKSDLKKKVDMKEFLLLGQRVRTLEKA